ncbi:MAG: sel1 repeat family protein [Clostridiales bacterium]|nr:sel1 repeat family protein [Clostridiales bacterium]
MENDKNKKKPEREIFEDIKFDEILDPTEKKATEREPIPPKKQRRVKKKPLNNRDYVHTYKYYSVEAKQPDVPIKTAEKSVAVNDENKAKTADVDNQTLTDFLKLRAEENDIPSVSTLAVLYYSQNKVDEAMPLFETAANAGYAEAERNLAIVLEIGESKETEKIFDLYNKAAEKEDVLALNNLGCCYLNGEGCEQDYKKVVSCFDKAARE